MRNARRVMVAKREGQLEPFEAAKLRRCLAAAMKVCDCDERFAEALTRAVELHLRDWSKARPPTTDYVFCCAHTALTETGMGHVAQYLARQRRRRAAQRRKVSVLDVRNPGCAGVRWRKAAVAQALRSRHGLSRSIARILAGEIEQRVLTLGYSTVSTTLIAELIRNELLAWGLADAAIGAAPPAREVDLAAGRQSKKEC